MTGLNSWLSPAVLHALGWALIHSLWQCAGVAALAALVVAFIRRPAVRYLVGVAALALMLAAPVATFLVLARPAAPVPVLQPAPMAASVLPATPPPSTPVAVFATADRAIGAIAEAPRQFPVGDMLPWLVAAWACGVAFFSLRFAGGFLLLEHRRRMQSHNPGARVLALCQELQQRLGLDRAIQYLECAWVEAPAVIGWLRPAVLLPVFALTGLSEEQFAAVIAHELAHIRRHDWLVNLFQVLVETLLFYHPAMWWLNRRIRIERELACDEIAVSLTGSRLEYARALAQMAEWKNVSLLAMAANRGPLTQRILHILGRKSPGAGQRVAGLTGGMLFLCAALAAANLLLGIAYPVRMAEAKESVRTALVSSQTAVAGLARRVVLTAKDAALPAVAPGRMDAAADGKADALAAPSPDLSRLLPNTDLATPIVVASNPVPMAIPKAQAAPDGSATNPAPASASSEGPSTIYNCQYVSPVWGRVISPEAIQMTGFSCVGVGVTYGSCPNFETNPDANDGSLSRRQSSSPLRACKLDVTMSVNLADPADASKMQPGKIVRLAGNFHVKKVKNRPDYLYVMDAKLVYVDPFDRQTASNDPPTAPQPSAKGSSAAVLNDHPVAPLTMREFDRHAEAGQPSRPLTEGSSALAADSGPAAAAPMAALSPSVTGTEPAMACLLGLSHWLCQHHFFAMRAMMSFPRGVPNCVDERHPNAWPKQPAFDSTCPQGVLEAVHYLGRNARGDDVYAVQYSHSSTTYVLQQPNSDGKVEEYWNRNIPSYMTAVPSQNAHKVALYRRPAQSSDPSDRRVANPLPAPTLSNQPVTLASAAAAQPGKTVGLAGDFQITRRDGTDLVTLASAAAPGLGRDPRNRTELAMKCWLGVVGYKGCWQSLCGSGDAGPLESVEYLGRTAAGADIYQVRYRFRSNTAYVVTPGPTGTADQYSVKATEPYRIKREISSSAAPILIYSRPEDAPPAGCSRGNIGNGQLNPVDSPP